MSEQESNVCAICGGLTRISYTIEFRECMPHSIAVDPNPVAVPQMRLCPGHPEPEFPRFGNTDEATPRQAIAVLEFFKLRCPALDRLAKEHPEPAPNHDGRLDEDYGVYMANGAWGVEGMILEYKGTTQAIIRSKAAISLLAWLEQNREELQRLAKEAGQG